MSSTAAYSPAEEIANAITHGLGALFSVAGLTLLLSHSAAHDVWRITSFSIYGTSLILLFLTSTIYHALLNAQAKQWFKLFDHCAIYLLIAGTYTPLMLLTIQGSLGYSMLALIWLFALAGILFKIKFGHRFKLLSVGSYLAMGAISLVLIKQLQQQLPAQGFALLAIGGALYAFGVIFYLMKKTPFTHAIWHLFVLAGAMCHYFMMLYHV